MLNNIETPTFSMKQFFFSHNSLIFSHNIRAKSHRHFFLQITISLTQQSIMLESELGKQWAPGFMISPGLPHKLDTLSQCCFHLFIEPSDPDYHLLAHRVEKRKFITLSLQRVTDIAQQLYRSINYGNAPDIAKINTLLGAWENCNCKPDDRINKATSIITQLPIKCISSHEISNQIHLSNSRFLHLFRDKMGVNFRGYLLWKRLKDALSQIGSDKSLTFLAENYGFADSAHFSRTCMTTFGIRPSEFKKAYHRTQQKKRCPITKQCLYHRI